MSIAEDGLEPVFLSPDEVATRLRDLSDERARISGPTPDLDPLEVASYLQELENETRLLLQIQGLQRNMQLLEAAALSSDQLLGQPLRLKLKSVYPTIGGSEASTREIHLQLGDYQVMKLKIGDWCKLLRAPDEGVPVELEIQTEDDEAPPALKGN